MHTSLTSPILRDWVRLKVHVGMMGMILAAEHPDEFLGLVLVDIAPFDPSKRPRRPSPPEFFSDEVEAGSYIRGRYPGFTPEAVESRMRHAFVRDEKD